MLVSQELIVTVRDPEMQLDTDKDKVSVTDPVAHSLTLPLKEPELVPTEEGVKVSVPLPEAV